jgi:hypothetical protein
MQYIYIYIEDYYDKVIVLNKLGLKVVPNIFLSSDRSLLPPSLKVLIDFPSTCHLGVEGHPSCVS